MSFVHLHLHSEFSLSQSLIQIKKLIPHIESQGMSAAALTDWGNLYGALHFRKACKGSSVRPLYGMEIGVSVEGSGDLRRHVVLLAKNQKGFDNLRRITSLAHTEYGFNEGDLSPVIPLDRLLELKSDLFFLTGGMKGILNSFLLQDQRDFAKKTLEKLIQSVGEEHLFLELQASGWNIQEHCNEQMVDWGKKYGVGVVATADCHYLKAEDALAHEVWMMVGEKMTEENNPRSSLISQDFYVKSPEEMMSAFEHVPEACSNTLKIAEACQVDFNFTDKEGRRIYHLPSFGKKGLDEGELFAKECEEGLLNRFKEVEKLDSKKEKIYQDRLAYEIQVITDMGFAGYYLIVSDFIRWAKRNEIPVGPGRGSGAGSICAWALDIIDLDPIRYGLLFERFLNPERVSLPDFDVDFCQARRGEVIRYVSEKYGADHVCQIVTYAKEQSKNALKDVGRVFGMSFGETNRLTKMIPSVQAKPLSILESLEEVHELQSQYESDPKVQQVVDLAIKIEGALRQPGVHAAGVIIASDPVQEISPVSRDVNGNLITQWDMKVSEEAGLVKFDFLGLVTLDHLDLSCKIINKRQDELSQKLNYQNIPTNDARAYKLIGEGDTLGVFQLESSGMQNLCTRIKPENFEEVAVINALFRPGPLETGMVDDYINRKFGRAKVEVPFEEMEPVLRETYGVIIYQEQVQNIARVVAGYTLGGADLLRRAMGKKIPEEMEAQRKIFVEGAVGKGKDAGKASELFDMVAKFAGYGFNKSHAAAYGKLAIQTAYLKAVYPTEFFTALLTIEKENTEKLSRYIKDARKRGIEILSPDVNESGSEFTMLGDKEIRFGMSGIKNVGEAAVRQIIEARNTDGPFKDLFDFLARTVDRGVNKRVVEALIQAGAFDSLTPQSAAELRGTYLETLESALEWATKNAQAKAAGQFSLFDSDSSVADSIKPKLKKGRTLSNMELLNWEKQLMGIYLSGSPLEGCEEKARQAGAVPIFELENKAPKSIVTIAAIVSEFREVRIKRGRRVGEFMGIVKVEDESSQVELISFPDHFSEYSDLFKSNKPLLIHAELDFEEGKAKLLCGDARVNGKPGVQDLSEMEARWPKRIQMRVAVDKLGQKRSDLLFKDIASVLKKHPGPVPVVLDLLKAGDFQTSLDLGEGYRVQPSSNLISELSSLLVSPGSFTVETVH